MSNGHFMFRDDQDRHTHFSMWWEKRVDQHRKATLQQTKAEVDVRQPENFPLSEAHSKAQYNKKEKEKEIRRENARLQEKIHVIQSNPQINTMSKTFKPKSMNLVFRKKEQEKIDRENQALIHRIVHLPPSYNFEEYEDRPFFRQSIGKEAFASLKKMPEKITYGFGPPSLKKIMLPPLEKINPLAQNERGYIRKMMKYAALGKTQKVKFLVEVNGFDPNSFGKQGETALHIACKYGHVDLVEFLIKHGANIRINCATTQNELIGGDSEPIHWAMLAEEESRHTIIQLLSRAGVNLNSINSVRVTPLHISCRLGMANTAILLLESGANPNIPSGPNQTHPIHLVVTDPSPDVFLSLTKHGAHIDARDAHGNTILHHLAKQKSSEFIDLVLGLYSDIHERNAEGSTPLHCAVQCGNTEFVRKLVTRGADPMLADDAGLSPLEWASVFGHHEILKEFNHDAAMPTPLASSLWDDFTLYQTPDML